MIKNFVELVRDRIQGRAPIGTARSKSWRKVRNSFLKKNPYCIVCGSKKKLTVHHIYPFHLFPDLELEEINLVTLCENGKFGIRSCHLAFGHLGNYKKFNPNLNEDIAFWASRLRNISLVLYKND